MECSALNGTSISYHPSPKAQGSLRKKELKDRLDPEVAGHHKVFQAVGHLHIWTHSNCDSMHKICSSSSQTKPWHGEGNGHEAPPQIKELLAYDSCWEGKSQSLRVWPLVGLSYSQVGSIFKSIWETQFGLDGEKKWTWMWWVHRWRWTWKVWGEWKYDQNKKYDDSPNQEAANQRYYSEFHTMISILLTKLQN